MGTNVITVTALDAASGTGTDTIMVVRRTGATVPSVSIEEPTQGSYLSTNSTWIALAGTAYDEDGIAVVTWENDRGGNGTASGTTSWSIASVSLSPGTNVITVTAEDTDGLEASAVLVVARVAGNGGGGGGDDFTQKVAEIVASEESGHIYGVVLPGDSSSRIYVGAPAGRPDDVAVRLLSPIGQLVGEWSGADLSEIADGVFAANLAEKNLASGTYIAELTVDGERSLRPVIVVR
jgi:hypothetical protein